MLRVLLSAFAALLLLAAAPAAASPVPEPRAQHAATNVYLLATPTPPHAGAPANATGLNLFDPYYQADYLLRAQPDGASYVPFNLTAGTLTALATGPHGVGGVQTYESNVDAAGSVFFLQNAGTPGLFSFKKGWLALNGSTAGFTDCEGDFGQRVIFWKGTDASCTETYIFKQASSPATD